MQYLLIDTCDWIYLAKDFPDQLAKLAHLVENGYVTLLLPERVTLEWQKNKEEKIIQALLESFDDELKAARDSRGRLHSHLSKEDANAWDAVLDGLEPRREQLRTRALDHISTVERLLNHPSTVRIPTTDRLKAQATDLALDKKTPFKNSMADGIIFLSALYHALDENIDEILFVSNNKRDFGADSDHASLHPDLRDLARETKVRYFPHFGEALNQIQEGLVSPESAQEIASFLELQSIRRALERNHQMLEAATLTATRVCEDYRRFYEDLESVERAVSQNREALEKAALKAAKAYEDYRRLHEDLGSAAARALNRNREALEKAALKATKVHEDYHRFHEGLRSAAEAIDQNREALENAALKAVKAYEDNRRSYEELGSAVARAVSRNRGMWERAALTAVRTYEDYRQFFEHHESATRNKQVARQTSDTTEENQGDPSGESE